jgi:negative regulator of sigma E activity
MSTITFSRYSSRYGLFAAAAVVLVAAFSLWSIRQAARTQRAQERAQKAEKAVKLLQLSHRADNTQVYKATSRTMARFGERTMEVVAAVMRAPDRLSITYLNGERKGLHTGYNGNYFWRQANKAAPLETYAKVDLSPSQMAAKRLDLTLKNYRARLLDTDSVDGHTADVVELRPRQLIDGAQGPIKRLWIDQETKLTLRIDTYNHKGQLVMSEVLSDLQLGSNVPAQTFAPLQVLRVASQGPVLAQEMGADVEQVEKATGIRPPRPTWLPPGFVFENVGVHHRNNAGSPYRAALSRYSDGVNVLTIFAIKKIEGGSNGENKDVADGAGAKPTGTCDFGPGTMVMRNIGDGRLVAVADLPQQTLQHVLTTTKVEFTTQPSGAR